MESQSDHKFKCEGGLRRHDGAGSDGFFESELFHEASPRAGSNLSPVAGPSAGGGPLVHEELPGAPGGGRCFRPATSLDIPGNSFQPMVRQGRSGIANESGDEDNCRKPSMLLWRETFSELAIF